MVNQEFVVNEETLSDGSKVYNIVAFDGKSRITMNAESKRVAEEVAEILNDGCIVGFDIESIA